MTRTDKGEYVFSSKAELSEHIFGVIAQLRVERLLNNVYTTEELEKHINLAIDMDFYFQEQVAK